MARQQLAYLMHFRSRAPFFINFCSIQKFLPNLLFQWDPQGIPYPVKSRYKGTRNGKAVAWKWTPHRHASRGTTGMLTMSDFSVFCQSPITKKCSWMGSCMLLAWILKPQTVWLQGSGQQWFQWNAPNGMENVDSTDLLVSFKVVRTRLRHRWQMRICFKRVNRIMRAVTQL